VFDNEKDVSDQGGSNQDRSEQTDSMRRDDHRQEGYKPKDRDSGAERLRD
jgi:hypothetical protein